MKIRDERIKSIAVRFETLRVGKVFESNGAIYLKTSPYQAFDFVEEINVVHELDEMVTPVNVELVVT